MLVIERMFVVAHEFENVSQIEHMCQSAQLAIDKGYDDEVILAAFDCIRCSFFYYHSPILDLSPLLRWKFQRQ